MFCLTSDTDWQRAGVTQVCAQLMMIRGLVDRQGSSYPLTDEGREVLAALLTKH